MLGGAGRCLVLLARGLLNKFPSGTGCRPTSCPLKAAAGTAEVSGLWYDVPSRGCRKRTSLTIRDLGLVPGPPSC